MNKDISKLTSGGGTLVERTWKQANVGMNGMRPLAVIGKNGVFAFLECSKKCSSCADKNECPFSA